MDVEIHPRGVRLIVRGRSENRRVTRRGVVDEFSESSRRNLAWAYSQGPWRGMLTLTYPSANIVPKDVTKKHLHAFLQHLHRRSIKYLWIMEFQRRGQVHYHVWVGQKLTWTENDFGDKIRPYFNWRHLVIAWLRIIGETDNVRARAVALHPASYVDWDVRVGNNYAAKYADKRRQKGLPTGIDTMGRWWARSRGLTEPVYRSSTDEGANAMLCRRVVHRYLCRVFPRRANLYWTPRQGIRVALNEKHLAHVCSILLYYLGPNYGDGRSRPDQWSISYRSAMSLHRRRWDECGAA